MDNTLYNKLQLFINEYPDEDQFISDITDPIYYRVFEILCNKDIVKYFPDFASLIRQILVNEGNLSNALSLRIPDNNKFPEISKWRQFSFLCTEFKGYYEIKPDIWFSSLKWVGLDFENPSNYWYKLEQKRKIFSINSDPFIKNKLDFNSYSSFAQREALASMLSMPNGSTLLVNLPTGSGKSLLFQYPVLTKKIWKSLTLVVIPTTSLALDQERRVIEILKYNKTPINHRLAWSYKLTDEEKKNIKLNIINGSQGILFVSPEAVVNNLLPSLYKAVKANLINYLFIDEAHLIAEWGDNFRIEYQSLAGIRNGLLNDSGDKPFKTLLLSATLSNECIDFIDTFYSTEDNPIQIISSIYLRPEPKYYVTKVDDNIKYKKVIELLNYVPRPVIIYTSFKSDAKYLSKKIIDSGFSKVAIYDGDTSSKQSELIVNNWATNKLDFIIATSAFGVGIDKNNIRTIIHATVPETLDRYYQEVGRGGRDGQSSISILIYSDQDKSNAIILNGTNVREFKDFVPNIKQNSKPNYISPIKGFGRWKKLIQNAEEVNINNNFYYLLDTSITGSTKNIDAQTDRNQYWNRFTLLTMAKSNMIKISSIKPNHDNLNNIDFADEQQKEIFWDNYFSKIPIQILDYKHKNSDNFVNKFQLGLDFFKNSKKKSLQYVFDVINNKNSMENVLDEMYSFNFKDKTIDITKTCSGCPFEPNGYNLDYLEPFISSITKIKKSNDIWHKKWSQFSNHKIYIYYENNSKTLKEDLKKAVEVFINKYDIIQLFYNDYKDIKYYTKDIEKMFFIDDIKDQIINKNIVKCLNNSSLTLLTNWDIQISFDSKYTLGLTQYNSNFVLLPNDIISNDNYRKRIFYEKDNEYITLKQFIKQEFV